MNFRLERGLRLFKHLLCDVTFAINKKIMHIKVMSYIHAISQKYLGTVKEQIEKDNGKL